MIMRWRASGRSAKVRGYVLVPDSWPGTESPYFDTFEGAPRMNRKILGLAILLGCLASACGNDDEGGKDEGSQPSGQSTSVEITAEDGGEVTLGEASLSIPG